MIRWACCLLVSAVVAAAVDYAYLDQRLRLVPFALNLSVVALLLGWVLRSWPAVITIPVAMYAGGWLGSRFWCAVAAGSPCAPAAATPVQDYLLYDARSLAILAVSAAAGVFLAKDSRPLRGRFRR